MEDLVRQKGGRQMSSKNDSAKTQATTLAELMAQLPTTSTLNLSKDGVKQIAVQVGAMMKPKADADKKD